MSFSATAFGPKGFDPKKLLDKIEAATKRRAQLAADDMTKTVATWHGERPKFGAHDTSNANQISYAVGMTGPDKGIKKWNWNNEGTAVRHAIMPRDYKRHKVPGKLTSAHGSDAQPVFISRNVKKPGIEPAGWTQEGRRIHDPKFFLDIAKVFTLYTAGIWK